NHRGSRVNTETVQLNTITGAILKQAFKVHAELGPGLLESAYKECLFYCLMKEGLWVEKEKPYPLLFENIRLDIGYRADLVVEQKVIVEIKSVDQLSNIHVAQVLTYLKLSQTKIGLLLNFNTVHLKDGIKRLIY
ncbi:MAG TPA: GxxExxY protein, partial [Ferruginibacter sp.]|nr:GxxExxY protein [Ferruginibacter sp.]